MLEIAELVAIEAAEAVLGDDPEKAFAVLPAFAGKIVDQAVAASICSKFKIVVGKELRMAGACQGKQAE